MDSKDPRLAHQKVSGIIAQVYIQTASIQSLPDTIYIYKYVCMYVCMYVCVYVCVCVGGGECHISLLC